MALGDKNLDNDALGESSGELRFAKPVRRRPSEQVADEIAAFQQKQMRASNVGPTNVAPTQEGQRVASQDNTVVPFSDGTAEAPVGPAKATLALAKDRGAPSKANVAPAKDSVDPEKGGYTRKDRADRLINRRDPRQDNVEQDPDIRSLIPAYALFTSTVLLLAAWLIGPRIVEEYHFAATRGKVRAQYENAVELLKDRPLENVSYASQLVAQKIRPSVVSIHAGRTNNNQRGYGSGVIMSREGYIISNAHVLEGANSCIVQLHDRSQYKAKLVGVDLVSDLAVLKIDANNLVPAVWGDSESAAVGSIVWAIGSPYRYEQTVTSGIISGKDRPGDKTRKQNLLQTDAAVNPGNSGGPLVDASGNVIGINTSIYGETFQGISFAVPSSTARFVYRQLIQNGAVVRGYLGVTPQEVEYQMASGGYLPDLDGAVLTRVFENSPADLAGFQEGDVIRQWNGQLVKQYNSLYQLAERSPPNSTVEVVLIRDGRSMKKNVVIGELPNLSGQYFIPQPVRGRSVE